MFKKLFEEIKKRRAYRKTHKELSKLSARELRDIGIEKSMITRISLEASYGKDLSNV